MQHYVPGFILQECEEKRYAGSITAFTLFFDIADFTQTSNIFRRLGSKGAEALSNYLTAAFAYPITLVESHGGFISHFAGDAFCAIFPGSDSRTIRQALSNIQAHFADIAYHDPDLGEFPISIRITLTHGKVEWKILRSRIQHEYVFHGTPLQEIYSLSNHKEACMLSEAVQKDFAAAPNRNLKVLPLSYAFSETTRQLFTKVKLVALDVDNEIRDAAYCFINLSHIAEDMLEKVIESIHSKLDDYNGYFNKIDATDKGLVALVLFGLPKATGNTLERMCRFALETLEEVPKLSFGLACGTSYAGFVGSTTTREYTALGSAVNLASRLMQKANLGEIVTDSYLRQEMHYKYRFAASETVKLKGFAVEVHSHKLLGRLPKPPQNFHTDFVGREAEIESLRKEAKEPGSRIIYISGEPGMGKSRLIIEALKAFPKSYFLFSDPSMHRLLEPIKQLVGQYFAIDPLFSKQRKLILFRQKWQDMAQDDKELIRIESIIGQLLGYEWERSVWSVLPPEEKPEQLKNAFVSFISRIIRDAKLTIHLDDPQWLDDSTLEYFRLLGEKIVEGVIVFASCRYLDGGNAVDLEIPNWESKHVDLALLTPDSAAVMIKQILGVERIPEDSLDWIVRKADGNPLFLEQVVAYLKENNCYDAEHKLVGNLDYLSSFGITDIIGSRIDSLTVNVRNTLQHACVLGLEFNTRVLCEMLSRKLDEDLGKGKQAKVWADLDELRYIFTHVLIKDTAYNRMLSDKLKVLHLLAAEAMVKLYKDDEKALNEHAEEIATHFKEAVEELEAAKYYEIAGVFYTKACKYDNAEMSLKKGLEIREKILGLEHPDTYELTSNLASLNKDRGNYKQAEILFTKVLKMTSKEFGNEHPKVAMAMDKLATVYDDQGKYKKSTSMHLKSIAILKKTVAAEHPFTAECMNNLAFVYENQGMYDNAEPLYSKALSIREKVLGAEHPETIVTLNNLAALYIVTGKYTLAEPMLLRALDVSERNMGLEHIATSRALNNLACLYYHQGKYALTEKFFHRSLMIMENILGTEHVDTVTTMNNLAVLCESQGNYQLAEQLAYKSLTVRENVFGKDHPSIALSLTNLARIFTHQGKLDQAESMLIRAVNLFENINITEHPELSNILSDLGSLYKKQGKYVQSENLFTKALAIDKNTLGMEHKSTATSLSNLADLYAIQGRYDLAEELNLQALAIREKILGSNHNDTAVSLHNLAVLYGKQSKYDQAEALHLKALAIREMAKGEEHPDFLFELNNLAILYARQDRNIDTEAVLTRVFSIRKKKHGLEHPDTQKTIQSLVETYEKLNQPDKAAEYRSMLLPSLE